MQKSLKKLFRLNIFKLKFFYSSFIYIIFMFSLFNLAFSGCNSNDTGNYTKSITNNTSVDTLQLKNSDFVLESMSDELVAHWAFDEMEGVIASDSSENDNDGSIIGAQWTDGMVGEGALSFDGTNDYVDCGTNEILNVGNKITIAAWIYNQEDRGNGGPKGWGAIPISKGDYKDDGWYWWIGSNGWQLSINSPDNWCRVSSSYNVPLEEWHHLASVINNDTLQIDFYVDGELISTKGMPFEFTGNVDRPLYLGRYSSSIYYNWKGQMDEVCIFNDALSESEIRSLSGIEHSSLAAHWMFEGNANDSSGNGNDGTVNDATWTEGKIGEALSFDGVNDYVEIGDNESLNINETVTISAWVYNQQDMGQSAVAICRGSYRTNGWYWWIDHKSWRIAINSPDNYARISSHYSVPFNEWHHLVSIIDNHNRQIHFYVDGVLQATEDMPFAFAENENSLYLGRYNNSDSFNWKGVMDDVRISNVALNDSEIQDLFQMGQGPVEVPAAPTLLSAETISSSRIDISWNDNSNVEAGYRIIRMPGDGDLDSKEIGVGVNIEGYIDTGLNADTTYSYQVCAYNSAGESVYTPLVSATTDDEITPSGAIIIDHRCVKIGDVPVQWIDQVKAGTGIYYGHTSHGEQLTWGLSDLGGQYAFSLSRNSLPNVSNRMCMNEFWAEPEAYWNSSGGLNATKSNIRNNSRYTATGFMWCDQIEVVNDAYIEEYFEKMEELEDYFKNIGRDVKVIYFTAMTDNSRPYRGELRYHNNEKIRNYCIDNDKILFDFADIEQYLYNSSGDVTSSRSWGTYGSERFPIRQRAYNSNDHGHTTATNCRNKAKAFWWMMARLAGWDGQ